MTGIFLRGFALLSLLVLIMTVVAIGIGHAFPGDIVVLFDSGDYRSRGNSRSIEFHDLRSKIVFYTMIPEEYDGYGVIMPQMLLNEPHRLPVFLYPMTSEQQPTLQQVTFNLRSGRMKSTVAYNPLNLGSHPDGSYELQRDADTLSDTVYRVDMETGERVAVDGLANNRFYFIDEDGTFLVLDAGALVRYDIDTLTEAAPEVVADDLPEDAQHAIIGSHALIYSADQVSVIDLASGAITRDMVDTGFPVVSVLALRDDWAGVLVRMGGEAPRGGDFASPNGATNLKHGLYTLHLPTGTVYEIDVNGLFDVDISVWSHERIHVSPDGAFMVIDAVPVGEDQFGDRVMVLFRLDGTEARVLTERVGPYYLREWLPGEDAMLSFVERAELAGDMRLLLYDASTDTRRVLLEGRIQQAEIDIEARRVYAKLSGEVMEFTPNSRSLSLHLVEVNLDTGEQRTLFVTRMDNQQLVYYPGE